MASKLFSSRLKSSQKFPGWYEFLPLKSSWESDLQLLKAHLELPVIVSVDVNASGENLEGFGLDDIDLISKFSQFRGLSICNIFEIGSVLENSPQLEVLETFGRYDLSEIKVAAVRFDLAKLKRLRGLNLSIKDKRREQYEFFDCKGLEHIFWNSDYAAGPKVAALLANISTLKTLRIHRSSIIDLDGLEKAESLQFLEIEYASKLSNIDAIAGNKSLTGLSLQNCSKTGSIAALSSLPNLIALHLESCKEVESLKPVEPLKLEFLNFYNTNISDGSIAFLKDMESLRHIHFNQSEWYVDARDYLNSNSSLT